MGRRCLHVCNKVCKRVDAADAIQLPSVPGGKRRGGTSEPETVLGCLLVDVQ